MPAKKKTSFEESLKKLEQTSEILKNDTTSLEASLKLFEEGIQYFENCNGILEDAKQKILIFDKNNVAVNEV